MEPLSIIASALAVAALSDNLISIVHRLYNTDKRLQAIHTQLWVEKIKTQAWLENVMRYNARPKVPERSLQDIERLVADIRRAMLDFEQISNHYSRHGSTKRTIATLKALKSAAGGFEELNTLIGLMKNFNEAVQVVVLSSLLAPPDGPAGEDLARVQRAIEPAPVHQSIALALAQRRELLDELRNNVEPLDQSAFQSSKLSTLWNDSVSAIRNLVRYGDPKKREHLSGLLERLRLWGYGLFQGELDMDVVLDLSEDHQIMFKEPMLTVLTQVAVVLATITNQMAKTERYPNNNELRNSSLQIRATIVNSNMTQEALQRWPEWFIETIDDKDNVRDQSADIETLSESIELLFNLLPGIRILRRQYILKLEKLKLSKQPEKASGKLSKPVRKPTEVAVSVDIQIEQNYEAARKVEEQLQRREVHADQSGKKVVLHSKRFAKERQRLEELRMKRILSRVAADPDVSTIEKEQVDLSESLQGVLDTLETYQSQNDSSGHKGSWPSAGDEKLALKLNIEIEKAIGILDHSTSDLWRIADSLPPAWTSYSSI